MRTNIRKKLVETIVLMYTSVIIPKSLLNSHIEVYYDDNELTRKIITYEYSQSREYNVKVYEPCSEKCPNETLSEGYDDLSYQEENEVEDYEYNEIPMIIDPFMLKIIQNRWEYP